MWIIDRYLLRQFLKTFFICFISLTGLYIVIDAFTHLEEFMRAGEKQGGLASVKGWYYAYRVVRFFDVTAGLLTLIAASFTATWIQRHKRVDRLDGRRGLARGAWWFLLSRPPWSSLCWRRLPERH